MSPTTTTTTTNGNNVGIGGSGPLINFAEWPRDAPTVSEERVLSIVCGNSRLHWALHEGFLAKFIPILFWDTPHIVRDDEEEDDYNDNNAATNSTVRPTARWGTTMPMRTTSTMSPCELLQRYIADMAHEVIFGSVTAPSSISAASQAAAQRKAPYLSIYVISTNPEQESELLYMFRDIPVNIVKFRNVDFFSTQQGLYPTMGVDRVAGLYASRANYGCPVMLLDGGTALTYTALDSNSNIMGGGITPGIKLRLQSLSDNCGKLPIIDHTQFKTTITNAMTKNEPLPFFATNTEIAMMTTLCSELACQLRNIVKQFVTKVQKQPLRKQHNNENGIVDDDVGDKDGHDGTTLSTDAATSNGTTSTTAAHSTTTTTTTAAGEVPSERPQKKMNHPTVDDDQNHHNNNNNHHHRQQQQQLHVVVTGGDGKFLCDLLKPDASNIIVIEPDVSPIPSNVTIHYHKTILHYGIGNLLQIKCDERRSIHPDGSLHRMVQGLRIVVAQPKPNSIIETDIDLKRGSVLFVEPNDNNNNNNNGSSVDEYNFVIRLDTGERYDWNVLSLYDGLVFYNEMGEATPASSVVMDAELWVQEKKRISVVVQEELAKRSHQIHLRQGELNAYRSNGELVDVLSSPAKKELERRAAERSRRAAIARAGVVPSPSKRSRGASGTATTGASMAVQKYVGRRVAKVFTLEGRDDPNVLVDEIFFGTVMSISDSKRLWFYIEYDDGDEEEYNLEDLDRGLQLYEENKADDDKVTSTTTQDDTEERTRTFEGVGMELSGGSASLTTTMTAQGGGSVPLEDGTLMSSAATTDTAAATFNASIESSQLGAPFMESNPNPLPGSHAMSLGMEHHDRFYTAPYNNNAHSVAAAGTFPPNATEGIANAKAPPPGTAVNGAAMSASPMAPAEQQPPIDDDGLMEIDSDANVGDEKHTIDIDSTDRHQGGMEVIEIDSD